MAFLWIFSAPPLSPSLPRPPPRQPNLIYPTRCLYIVTIITIIVVIIDNNKHQQFHAIGFEGLIHEATGKYVHHLVLQGYHGTDTCGVCDGAPNNSSSSGNDDMTDSPSNSSDSNSYPCGKFTAGTLYGWAPGVSGLLTPDDVGFRFGTNEGGFQSIGEFLLPRSAAAWRGGLQVSCISQLLGQRARINEGEATIQ